MNKYEKILNDTWEYLEYNYKSSEIDLALWISCIDSECDNNYCLTKCIKLLWSQWEFLDLSERDYYIKYIKDNYDVVVR